MATFCVLALLPASDERSRCRKHDADRRARFKRQRQIAGSAAHVQNARAGPFQNPADLRHRARAPVTIDIQSTADDSAGRSAGRCGRTCRAPSRSLLLRLRAGRRGAWGRLRQQASASSIAAATFRSCDVGGDFHRADALRQNEMNLALHGLLVALQARGNARRIDARQRRQRTVGIHAAQNLLRVLGRKANAPFRASSVAAFIPHATASPCRNCE